MIKKITTVLGMLFFTQFLLSCFPCKCPQPKSWEVHYSELTVTAYNTSGFQYKDVEDTVHRNAFGLGVSVSSDLIELAGGGSSGSFGGFGYANALSCDCIADEYTYSDPIDYMEIFVTDTKTSEVWEVTDLFTTYSGSDGNLVRLDEFFKQREDWQDGFQMELAEYKSIPHSAVFRVDAYLKSGKMLSKQTQLIHFFN